jgi:Copper amine oxidase N-terminal domain
MMRKQDRPFLALLLAVTLALGSGAVPQRAGAVDRPAASKLENGYLLIGTYLIQKDALTKPLLDIAKASMAESDQGMYYKSEFAAGAWCNIKNGVDIKALLKGEGVVVPDADVDAMKITVWATLDKGKPKFVSLQTPAELDGQIKQLTDQKAQAEEQNKQALKDQNDQTATDTALQIANLQMQIDFLQALKTGDAAQPPDPQKVLDGLPTSPAEALNVTKQDVQKALAALDSAVTRSAAKEAADQLASLQAADRKVEATRQALLQKSLADLVTEQAKLEATLQDIQTHKLDIQKETLALQAILNKANKLGEAEITGDLLAKISENAAQLPPLRNLEKQARFELLKLEQAALIPQSADPAKLVELVHVETLLKSEDLGIASKIADLQEAQVKLNLEIDHANKDGDAKTAADLGEDLAAVELNLAKSQQEELILEKEALEVKRAQLPQGGDALDKRHSEVIQQILALERKKYTAADLAKLDAVRAQIAAALGASGSVLQVENVYSKDVEIKFQVPTVVIGGRAFIHIRPISEAFGATVVWNDDAQSVTINLGGTVVYSRIGDDSAYINDRKVQLDAAPLLIADRTFVPLRFVMDALGLDVQWDEETQSIEIKGIVKG